MVDFNNFEYRSVVLAAFLHDIGKLLERFESEQIDKARHPEFSAQFISSHSGFFSRYCDAALLRELVQKHHESRDFPDELKVQSITDPHTRSLAKLVSLADNLSSSERGDSLSPHGNYKKVPLCSVIERLHRDSEGKDSILKFRPMPLPSTLDEKMQKCIFPEDFSSYQSGELNRQIEAFGREFEKYIKSAPEKAPFTSLLSHLNTLLYKYAWCIPSSTLEDYPDVSLYDHLKISAAIAACLYQYHAAGKGLDEKSITAKTAGRFLILAGDISGIQNYIFDITSAGDIARKLRARSLIVQSFSEIAAHRILHRFNLPLWNNIMSAGGNFYLLLPALRGMDEELCSVQAEMDRWFLEKMNGELAINLAWHAFGNEGFKPTDNKEEHSGFSNVLYEVKKKLDGKKQNRFLDVLYDGKRWKGDSFVVNMDFGGKGICKSCYKFPGAIQTDDGVAICIDCKRQRDMGARLPGSDYLAYFAEPGNCDYSLLDYGISIAGNSGFSGDPYQVTRLNDPDISAMPDIPASFKYLATHVPRGDSGVKTFQEMASRTDGQPLLGFLKADVDNLGESFVLGFKRDGKSIDTISRQATFSRLLDVFFSGWVEHLVSTYYKDCYTVFSGGDDLFYIGPWRQIIDLATQINADFACFANGRLTLSAGIFIARHDYPVARAAEEVNKALKKSKDGGQSGEKNRITILDRTLTWEEWEQVKKEWEKVLPFAGDVKHVKSSFLYNLLDFADMWRGYVVKGNTRGLRYHPMLAYNMTRNISSRDDPELYQWASGLLKWPPDNKQKLVLDNLGLIATFCLYNRRGGNDDSAI